MRSLHVGLVHPYPWPEVRRGAERYLSDLSWFLHQDGHRVDIITGNEQRSGVTTEDGVCVRRRRFVLRSRLQRRGVSPVDTFGLVALPTLVRRRYDVVHALVPSAAIAARLAGQRTVYTVLGHPTPDQLGARPLNRTLMTSALRLAHQVTVLSHASLESSAFLTRRRLEVLPPGLRTDRFVPDLRPRTGPLRVLFSADASDRRKGADRLLRAFALVLHQHPDARVQHSGAGNLDWALDALDPADRRAVEPALDRLGTGDPSETPARYRAASVTVLPARHEAFGLAVVESLASGTPAVCIGEGGPPEILDDPAVGVVVPLGDDHALAAAITRAARLAEDPATPRRCSEHARRWDWAASVGPRHVDLYRRMLAGNVKP